MRFNLCVEKEELGYGLSKNMNVSHPVNINDYIYVEKETLQHRDNTLFLKLYVKNLEDNLGQVYYSFFFNE